MNFYQISSERAGSLSSTERNILDFVVKNLPGLGQMSIRRLAENCYVSTATIFRFVKKLGFEGYSQFISSIGDTLQESSEIHTPAIAKGTEYQDSYLRNIIESVKVIKEEKSEMFHHIMERYPRIYLLAAELSRDIANYIYQVLTIYGYRVELPSQPYEVKAVTRRIKKDDVVIALSYSGNNEQIVQYLEEIFAVSTPTIISFTRADNNVIQNMSDLNFYAFADEKKIEGIDITSRCGMLAVFEVLMYQTIANSGKNESP